MRIINTIQITIFLEVMTMKENYIYPAKIKKEGISFQIEFLDFPNMCMIEGNTEDEEIGRASCRERV